MLTACRTWRQENPWITGAVWFNAALLAIALALLPFDHRQLLGLDVWIKPIKFDLSVILYLVTLAVVLRLLGDRWVKPRRWLGCSIAVSMILENAIITLQAARGLRSHFNFSTPLESSLFAIMGVFVIVNKLAIAGVLALWCAPEVNLLPAQVWSLRLGLLAFLAGSLEALFMFPRRAHTVGAADGGAGLPFLNWSRVHGDLRVAHFFALHALQAMMLLGWLVSRRRWPGRVQVATVTAVFAAYMGAVWLLFAQAMAGRSVF
jgi:hypothetical protein